MRQILNPRGVAVFGASDDAGKFGGRIMRFLLRHGFPGTVVPINARRDRVLDLPAFPRLADAPRALVAQLDVAILAVAVAQLEAALRDCAASGLGAAVVITTGFAEAGPEGAAAQTRLLAIAQDAGMRLVGPNCMGFVNTHADLALCSSVVLEMERLPKGPIGLVSQSGALMVSLIDRALWDGIGLSSCVSLGNQADVEICEVLDALIDDPATEAIGLYVEGFRDGQRFLCVARACRTAGKPLVVLKAGRSDDGVRAAQSHTASLAGSFDAFAAVCRAEGVALVDDPVTMLRLAELLRRGRPKPGTGIGVLSGSGGGTGIMADRIADAELRLARLSRETRVGLGDILLPPQADNPVDLGGKLAQGEGDAGDVAAMRLLAADPDVGTIVLYLSSMPFFERRARLLAETALASGKPVLAVLLPGPAADAPRAALRALGCFQLDSTDELIPLLQGLHQPTADTGGLPRPADLSACVDAPLETLPAAYGVPFPAEAICDDLAAAERAADHIGYPIVLKGLAEGVAHKTDLGLVRVGVSNVVALRDAWSTVMAAATAAGQFRGCLVQEQVPSGLELIASIRHDPQFGPMLLVGAGGILVEVLRDTATAAAPVTPAAAEALLRTLRLAPLLDGVRGQPPRDLQAACDAISRLSWLACDLGSRLDTLEINPLIVGARGQGVRAVDLRITHALGMGASS